MWTGKGKKIRKGWKKVKYRIWVFLDSKTFKQRTTILSVLTMYNVPWFPAKIRSSFRLSRCFWARRAGTRDNEVKSTFYDSNRETQWTVAFLFSNFGEKNPHDNSSAQFVFIINTACLAYKQSAPSMAVTIRWRFSLGWKKNRLSQAFGKVHSSLLGSISSKILCCHL